MLLGFITSGMRSEGVHKIEQKLANQLKATQNRILSGFTRDVAIIRKIINEANLVKLKVSFTLILLFLNNKIWETAIVTHVNEVTLYSVYFPCDLSGDTTVWFQ